MRRPSLLLLPFLFAVGCAAAGAKPPMKPTPIPATPAAMASPGPGTGWRDAHRRGSIIEATPPAAGGTLVFGYALVDTAGNRVFVTGSDGTLDAVELSTGARIFHSRDAQGAIRLLGGGALATLDAGGRLVLLDATDGTTLFVSDPSGARAEKVTSVSVGKERLRVAWSVHNVSHGGAYQRPSTTEGAFTVNLRTGTVERQPPQVHEDAGPVASWRPFLSGDLTLEVVMNGGGSMTGYIRTMPLAITASQAGKEVWRHPVPAMVQDIAPYP